MTTKEKPPAQTTQAAEEAAIRAKRRVHGALKAAGMNPERFVANWCRAQAEYEAAR